MVSPSPGASPSPTGSPRTDGKWERRDELHWQPGAQDTPLSAQSNTHHTQISADHAKPENKHFSTPNLQNTHEDKTLFLAAVSS